MKLIFALLIFLLSSNVANACQWYGDKASYKRFGIDIGFVGKLIEKGTVKDELGNILNQWARFEPVKLIHGKWKLSQKFYFGKKLGFPIMVKDRLYVVHADNKGEYVIPCYKFYGFKSFDSTKDERYINFSIYLDNPTPENYKNVH